MKFSVVIPINFSASKNILNNLEKLKIPKNLQIIRTEKESINNENIDNEFEADYFIFATRHQSREGIKCLCVHPPGNFNDNSLGGKEKELNFSMPSFMKIGLNFLEKHKLKDFEIEIEATHHGPFLKKEASTLTLLIIVLISLSSFPIFFPKIVITPVSGTNNVLIILIKVDFPHPLGPRTPRISPSFILKDTSITALNLSFLKIFFKENFCSASSNCFETLLTANAYFIK